MKEGEFRSVRSLIYGWTVDASGVGGDEGRGQAAISCGELAGKR